MQQYSTTFIRAEIYIYILAKLGQL